jgi:hypothetical protein
MAGNLFQEAAKLRKKHPGMTMPEAVKKVSKKGTKRKPAAKKKTAKKKATRKTKTIGRVKHKKAPRKRAAGRKSTTEPIRKVKFKVKKNFTPQITISGVSMGEIRKQHDYQHRMCGHIKRHQAKLKDKGLTKAEKEGIRRDIRALREQIAASKKHITVLKRSI